MQGAFAALLVSSTKSLLISVYVEARDRARAIGIFTATLTAGLAVGLVLGGVVTTVLGWRWCLYVNIPLSMVAIIGAPRVLPAVRERREVRIDTASAVMATVGMVALVYGLSEVPSLGWTAAEVVGCLATAAAVLGAFVARQATTAHPLLPIRVVLDRNRAGGLVAMVFNGLSTFGMLLILTYQLQAVMRYSPLRTGYALVPFAVAAALGSAVLAPRLAARVSPRWQIVAGLLLSAAGLVLLAGLTASSHYVPWILFAELVEGLGTGLGGPPILQTSLRAVLPADAGAASAASSTAGQLGSSLGVALLNTIAASATAVFLASHTAASLASATVHGYAVAMLWGAVILLIAAVPVVLLVNVRTPTRTG